MEEIRKAAIVGLGLIGGSLGMALVQGKLVPEVVGIDLNPASLTVGKETQAIHWGTTSLQEGLSGADLVVLAVPVGAIPSLVKAMVPWLKPGCIVTDVGSTKAGVVKILEENLGDVARYVGGHPMTGSERSGIEASDPYLFENAIYILTPTPRTDKEAIAVLETLLNKVGARIMQVDPEEHDLMVAAVSHFPHLMAVALVEAVGQLAKEHPRTLQLAAGGFRDTTRIAAGHPIMWRDICLANRDMVLEIITRFRRILEGLEKHLRNEDGEALAETFRRAGDLRRQIPAKMKGALPGIFEVVVTVPDKPGVIGHFTQVLGEKNINIADIEILRVREGEGGTIRLGFSSEDMAQKALTTLKEDGIMAKRR